MFDSASTSTTLASPTSASTNHGALLLIGDDLAWLAGRRELAGRKIILADPQADALALLAQEPLDGVVASFSDVSKSVVLLKAAATSNPALVALLRADGKELAGVANSFPVLPRVDAVEVLDDQLRTRLVAATWQAKPEFAKLVKMITQTPTLPNIYTQITAALQNPDASLEDVADLVTREPAVSAKLLQMVNSPLLALRGRVTSVRDATGLLGLSRLRSLVLATCLFRQFDASKCRSFSMSKFEATSLQIAAWASSIAKSETRDKHIADMAFTASLLHNFGVLLLAANVPDAYEQVLRTAQEQRVSIAWTELEVFGATHAEVAGAILASWGIPFPIVNAVGWYPVPSSSEDTAFSPLTAVHAATAVDAFAQSGMFSYDRSYMERLHLAEKVENWCATLPAESLAA
ncbi:MAG: HDOD domain-containing protein [Chthoniobacter sp.]|nr:HDOD domain-containing protein [Chthoniobacter sp.]